MRELKFRVWSNYWKKYATEAELYMDGSVDAVFDDDSGVPHHENTDLVIEFDTGLRDKNGKEIYEGDIVRIDSMDELRVGYVELVADQYFIICGEDEEGCKIVAEFYYYSKPEENCEVIGNIHENPELLEEGK